MPTSNADKPPVLRLPPDQPRVITASLVSDIPAGTDVPPAVRHESAGSLLLQWVFLLLSLTVMLGSLTFRVRHHTQVVVPIVNRALPGTCTFREITGVPCPGCGLTRSFISLGHGHMFEAWTYNPAGFLFFAVVAFQVPYRVFQIVRIHRGQRQHRFAYFDSWVLIALVAVLLVQWAWRLLVRAPWG